ncbi:MAG: diaminopimelate epimerase [Bryobacteraceae bacterium]|nr:diaminopimelate epimerase [Bryobacteraceae bacterium]MDW8377920.1 diaminopimelate epimerase [Bryobacterales bacterium]
MKIPFAKAHGARNDFLLTWAAYAPKENHRELARAICDRHVGVGADGWLIVTPAPRGSDFHASIQLYNSDGSDSEISGNGTRCAAAFLLDTGLDLASGEEVRIRTGAGLKTLRLLSRRGLHYEFEMNMGKPEGDPNKFLMTLTLEEGPRQVIAFRIGNPQCAVLVDHFDFDWRELGRRIELHPQFPQRTNVSFVRVSDRHSLEVRFWERGAGETQSSGTGSAGAYVAARVLGLVESPVDVYTPAGILRVRQDDDIYLQGPAEIVAGGEFYWERNENGKP